MPAVLRFFKADPNKLGRGRGIYYRRGPSFKGVNYMLSRNMRGNIPKRLWGYYSKYERERDKNRRSKGWRVNKIGLNPKGGVSTNIPQVSDGRLWR